MHDSKIAKACHGKDIHQELQTFCAELLADQIKESDQMTAWLQAWYGKTLSSDTLPLWLETPNGEVFERYFVLADEATCPTFRACDNVSRGGNRQNLGGRQA